MPIYEYVCQRCGHAMEVMQKVNDPVLLTCPQCHAKKLAKKMSSTSFVLKGTGWYKTDYPAAGTAGSSAPKKETKPAAEPVKAASPTPPKKDAK